MSLLVMESWPREKVREVNSKVVLNGGVFHDEKEMLLFLII